MGQGASLCLFSKRCLLGRRVVLGHPGPSPSTAGVSALVHARRPCTCQPGQAFPPAPPTVTPWGIRPGASFMPAHARRVLLACDPRE